MQGQQITETCLLSLSNVQRLLWSWLSRWALITAASLKCAAEFIRGAKQRNEEVGDGRRWRRWWSEGAIRESEQLPLNADLWGIERRAASWIWNRFHRFTLRWKELQGGGCRGRSAASGLGLNRRGSSTSESKCCFRLVWHSSTKRLSTADQSDFSSQLALRSSATCHSDP